MGILGVIFLTIVLGEFFNKKFEECIGVAIMISSFLLYFTGFLCRLNYGASLLLAVYFCSFIYVLISLKNKPKCFREVVLTWGSFYFLTFVILIFFYNLGRDYSHPDEYIMWGLLPKTFWYYNELFNDYLGNFRGGYPPLTSLWVYFANYTWKHYSSTISLWAQGIMTISFLIPVFSLIKEENKGIKAGKSLIVALIVIILPYIRGLDGLSYILQDSLLGAVACYMFYNFVLYLKTKDIYYQFALVVSISFLSLTKRTGVIIATLLLVCLLYTCGARKKEKQLFCFGTCITVTFVVFTWYGSSLYSLIPIIGIITTIAFMSIEKKILNVMSTYKVVIIMLGILCMGIVISSIPFEDLYDLSFGVKLALSFVSEYCSYNMFLTPVSNYLSVPCFLCSIALFALAAMARNGKISGYMINADMYESLGAVQIIYALGMYVIYFVAISPANENTTWLEDRYFSPWVMLTFYLIMIFVITEYESYSFLYTCISLFICISLSNTKTMLEDYLYKWSGQEYNAISDLGINLDDNDWIFFIDEEPKHRYTNVEFGLSVIPARTNNYDSDNPYLRGRFDINVDDFQRILLKDHDYSYVYIQTVDDDFIDRYSELFISPDEFSPGAVYSVIKENGTVRLRKMQ